MSEYQAPVREMQFVLDELAGLDGIAKLPGCGEITRELVAQILEENARFSGEVLAPLNQSGDREGSAWENGEVRTPKGFRDAYRKFAEGGWTLLQSPPEHGGKGLPKLISAPVVEMWRSANLAFSLCPVATSGAIELLHSCASEEIRNTYLPKMVEGRWSGTMNLTEPQAGSDLSLVKTMAVRNGETHRVAGQKIFITYGEHDLTENIVHLVLARTPNAPEGVKGLSLFVVPKFLVNADGTLGQRNDIQCVSIEHKLGIRASPTAVLVYGGKEGAVGYVVGEENRGLEYMFVMMNHARFSVGLEGVAIAERAYQQALSYSRERMQGRDLSGGTGPVPIIRHPDVRRMLMSMKSQIEAMRSLAYVIAAWMDIAHRHPDRQERKTHRSFVDLMLPVLKGWSSETGMEIASTAIQVHGGMGYIEETGAAQHYRDARITAIYEGTTGIQSNDLVGRKIAREGGTTAKAVIEMMHAVEADLEQASGNDMSTIHSALADGVSALADCVGWIVDTHGTDARAVHAVSVPFLKLMGIVAGGWQLGRAALIAQNKIAAAKGDSSFYETRIATARFYADHVLSQAPGLRDAVIHGAAGVLALSEDQF